MKGKPSFQKNSAIWTVCSEKPQYFLVRAAMVGSMVNLWCYSLVQATVAAL